MIELKNIGKTFQSKDGEVEALKDVSIKINDGDIFGIIGMSGAGKSTLVRCINMLEKPSEGTIEIDGEDVGSMSKPKLREMRRNVTMIFQGFNLLMQRNCLSNICFPLELAGMKKKEAREQAAAYFDQFGLTGTEKKYPAQLSGGMKQRAALLRTYLFSGEVALLDEPFSALDMLTKQSIHEWYLDVMGKIQLSTLFITHDIDEAILLSDRIYLLTGKPGEITKEIVIEEQKPRSKDFSLSENFLQYKREILAHLEGKNVDEKNVL